MTDGYKTTDEVAAHYHASASTIRYWRMNNYGPKYLKIGRRVLYPDSEIERFDRELKKDAGIKAASGGRR